MDTSKVEEEGVRGGAGLLRQPKAVWAVAFACVVAFMGLGLVDPILPVIAEDLDATPGQVELLFTSYLFVTGIAMVVTGFVSSRIGQKTTLLVGLGIIVLFAALAGFSGSIGEIVGFRAGWGLGNALFIATALAVIVEVSTAGTEQAVILYEAALGLGISVGPLLGGLLGGISWRGPFLGVAGLMSVGFVAVFVLLPSVKTRENKESALDPIRALKHRGLLTLGVTAFFYNFGFFTLLAYTPFPLGMGARGLGFVFFGWGVMLAFASVFVAPRVQSRFGTLPTMYFVLGLVAVDLVVMGMGAESRLVLVAAVVSGGAFLGIINTLITTAVMQSAPVARPVASASYSFIRFMGGAIAPALAGVIAHYFSAGTPFVVGGIMVFVSIAVLFSGRGHLESV